MILVLALAAADDYATLAKEAISTAEKVRGLQVKGPIRTEVTGREAIERYVAERIAKTDARSSFALTQAALLAFGLTDEPYDVEGLVRRVARDQIAGYYDWEKKTLYVANWIPPYLQKPTLVHEATHALQDQYFGIGRFMEPIMGCSEPSTAVASLLEGDATVAMLDALAGTPVDAPSGEKMVAVIDRLKGILALASGLGDVPRVLRESLFFPYLGGVRLVLTARSKGGAEAVNDLYKDPPVSTEQVLHPEKLFLGQRDTPRDVRFTVPSPGRGLVKVGSDQMGELTLRLVLEETLSAEEAARAAEGWDGDRLWAWRRGKEVLALLVSVWDSDTDAVEAEAALKKTKAPPLLVERRGAMVLGVWGPKTVDPKPLAEKVWPRVRTTKVRTFGEWRKACARGP